MNAPQMRAALRSGQRVYGTLITSDSPRWPAQVAQIGLDFVFIDTEHVALDRLPLSWMCQMYGALGMAPIVRIPSPDPFAATMALDAGAVGVVAPYIETVEQAGQRVNALRLEPRVMRSVERQRPLAITLWLSADERRVPLRALVDAGFGRFRLELKEYRR